MEKLKEFFADNNSQINAEIEQQIGKYFLAFLNEPKLMSYHIACVHRIVQYYFMENPNQDLMPIINFFFKCLDNYGGDGSIFFNLIDVNEHEDFMLDILFTKYANIFEAGCLNQTHFIYVYNKMKALERENMHLITQLRKSSQ